MEKIYYDLHIHSCLSPCGEMDMTPFNIAGMAKVKELDVIALCDHNTCKNCEMFLKACDKYEIIGICGMELTTSEEIHLICLFKKLDNAMDFSSKVENFRMKIKNKPDIFGPQAITDEDDNIVGYDDYLLSIATELSLEDAYKLVYQCGGKCFPAHIDKASNSLISVLGLPPSSPKFQCVEFHNKQNISSFVSKYFTDNPPNILLNSDAHLLWDISEKENYLLADLKEKDEVIQSLFQLL